MKVTIVSSVPVFPVIGGNRARILEFSKAMRELGHEIQFIYLPLRRQHIDLEAHEQFFGGDNFNHLHNGGVLGSICQWLRGELRSKLRNALQQYLGLRGWYYSTLDGSYNPGWSIQIRRLVKDADVAIVEYVFNTRAFEGFLPGVLRVLDTHDAFAERHLTYAKKGLRNGYWISLRAEEEARGLLRADRVMAIQESEATLFREQLAHSERKPDVIVISHFPSIKNRICDYSKNDVAVFVGSDNPANRQALVNFTLNILPLIRMKIPGFRLLVAGRISDFARSFDDVECLGFVDDAGEVYREAPLSINPMLTGTGIAIKLLEAMSHGVPSVTTQTGARGFPSCYQVGNIVVEDEDCVSFADAVIRLCSDERLRSEMGAACHEAAQAWRSGQLRSLQECLES
ncbi:glycosyltransferase family 4 protein [Pseudoxanthomonas sp. J35]|uniref:glycosyltransferase family 4 protein n=1 Tax=Pseudoxanthomonas sp. J35 TaxID=935852 RepID=UPI0018DC42F1|nr:glycosyltransferase family 4 protein [Pseudoxanthomonas sp. J35]